MTPPDSEYPGAPAADTLAERLAQALTRVEQLATENTRLVELAEQRSAWAEAGTQIATALLSGTDVDDVLRSIVARVAELADADVAAALVPGAEDYDTLTVVSAVGPHAGDVGGVRLPLAGTQIAEAHRTGVPVILHAVTGTAPEAALNGLVGELGDTYGPVLALPLGGPPALATVVALRRRDRRPFDHGLLEGATIFATQTTVALEMARSQQRERRLQVEGDRDRIARDLHDHIVQRIFATGLALDRIGRSLEADAPDVAARIAERVDELDTTIARIRSAIFELRNPDDTEPEALRRRVGEVIRSVIEGHELRPDLRIRTGDVELPGDLASELVAVVRELVTNVVRHADATRLTVTVTVGQEIRVVVADDGRGLPTVMVRSGLANLADRAERRHGRLSCRTDTSGTEIEWLVPFPQ